MQGRPRRPTHLMVLIILEGVNSISQLLWGVLLPVVPFHASQVFVGGKSLARLLVVSVLSILGFVVAGGLWMRRPSAFRMGLALAVFTTAFAIFWTVVSLSSASFDLGFSVVLILNVMMIFFLLQPTVARAMIAREKR